MYEKFSELAHTERRSMANLIETLALKKLEEESLIDDFEMDEIINNKPLLEKLSKGHIAAKEKRGQFVD